MLLVPIIALVLFSKHSTSSQCVIEGTNEWEQKLLDELMSKSPKLSYQQPCKNSTEVSVRFLLKYFFFDNNEWSFSISTWAFVSWDDPGLAWKPEDFDGIDETPIHIFNIWIPASLFDGPTGNSDSYSHGSPPFCGLRSNGKVSCIQRIIHTTTCRTKLYNWPHDTQNCSFSIIARTKMEKSLDDRVTFYLSTKRGISAFGVEYGAEWDIIDFGSKIVDANDTTIEMYFVVQRQAISSVTVIIVPVISLAIFTLSSMFLDLKGNKRVVILAFSLIGHFNLLSFVNASLPRHGIDEPLLLCFVRHSVIVTGCAIILTVVLRIIQSQTSSVQVISTINARVLETRVKYLVFPKWSAAFSEVDVSRNAAESWTDFSCVVNSLFIYIFAVVYLISYLVNVPVEPPYIE